MLNSKIQIFNIFLYDLDYKDFISITKDSIESNKKISIGYVNPHVVRLLDHNTKLLNIFNSFDYLRADGIGMKLASKILFNNRIINPLNWTDNSFKYLNECAQLGYKIFFLGGSDEIINKCSIKIKSKIDNLNLVGYLNGYDELNDKTIEKINLAKTNILWVGLGSPKQEIWVQENIKKLNVNIIQCVGDVYSHLAGKRLRGPKILRDYGFEWLFRLFQHPIKYFNRYVIGIPIFIYLIVKYKIKYLTKK